MHCFRSDSNSNLLTHPARRQAKNIKPQALNKFTMNMKHTIRMAGRGTMAVPTGSAARPLKRAASAPALAPPPAPPARKLEKRRTTVSREASNPGGGGGGGQPAAAAAAARVAQTASPIIGYLAEQAISEPVEVLQSPPWVRATPPAPGLSLGGPLGGHGRLPGLAGLSRAVVDDPLGGGLALAVAESPLLHVAESPLHVAESPLHVAESPVPFRFDADVEGFRVLAITLGGSRRPESRLCF